jgi:hypothetical protein
VELVDTVDLESILLWGAGSSPVGSILLKLSFLGGIGRHGRLKIYSLGVLVRVQ